LAVSNRRIYVSETASTGFVWSVKVVGGKERSPYNWGDRF
jgi:hypothetical protein